MVPILSRLLALVAVSVAALTLCTVSPARASDVPVSREAMILDFEDARVVPGTLPDTWILVVNGQKPYMNMQVRLVPLVYVQHPEYWGIEVVGNASGIGLPALAPYRETLPLDASTGTRGIEVIGASRTKRINVP